MTTLQGAFTSGELSPSLTARVDLAKYGQGCRTLRNMLVQPHGGAVKRPGFRLVDVLPGEAVMIPFVFNAEQSYVLVFGEKWLRVASYAGFIANAGNAVYQIASPYTLAQAKTLSWAQSADVLFLACHGVRPQKLKRLDHANWKFEAMTFVAPIGPPVWDSKTVVSNWSEYPLAYSSGTAFSRTYNNYTYEYTYSAINQNLYRKVDQSSTTTVPSVTFVNGAKKSDDSVSPAQLVTPYTYYLTTVDADGNESVASDPAAITGPASNNWQAGDYIALAWKAVAGADEYRVYKSEFGGRPGFIATTGDTGYKDYNSAPILSDGPPKWVDPFADGDFPATVCLFEQRLVFASSPKRPQTIWMSRSGDYDNFSSSVPTKADDSLEMTIASNEVSRMCWMVALRSLVLGTTGMEWEISSPEGAFTATSRKATPQSYRGSAALRALVIGNTILHITRSGNEIRDFKYDFGSDSYAGTDRTILAEHLFSGKRMVSWSYQASPDSIIWVVRNDGVLLGMTFQPEHEVFAWHQHTTDGGFVSVCSIPHEFDDELFVITRRSGKFYLEMMAERFLGGDAVGAEFLDCCLTYRGASVKTISGLEHLEGKTVGILADGAVQAPREVAGGSITLDSAASVVTVGLPYTGTLITMPVEIVAQDGTSVARKKVINAVNVLFRDTVLAKVGVTGSMLEVFRARTTDPYGQGPTPVSGMKRTVVGSLAATESTVSVVSDDPLPMTVLALVPEVDVK